jgi:nucleoside-triphosphatase THEP1
LAGKKQSINNLIQNNKPLQEFNAQERLTQVTDKQSQYPIMTIFFLFGGMVLSLYLINTSYLIFAVIIGIVFISVTFINYKTAFKRLKKPGLWIQFIVITIIAAISWEWIKTENFYSTEGLVIAMKMNFRAVLMILGFAAISVELRSPVVRVLLTRHGFASVYAALNISFGALPSIISVLPKGKDIRKERKNLVNRIFSQAQNLLYQFENQNTENKNLFVITGNAHEGKTTFARQVAVNLTNSGFNVTGFLAPGKFEQDIRISFELENLKNNERILLCNRVERKEWAKFGPFYFDPEAINYGNQLIQTASSCEILFVDEVGKLELVQKKGWYPGIKSSVLNPRLIQVWIVRKDYIPLLYEHFHLNDGNIFDINITIPEQVSESIAKQAGLCNLDFQTDK